MGKDGVGDYVRRLSGELIRKGHRATVIGLMDKYVAAKQEEAQRDGTASISVLRIPYRTDYAANFQIAHQWIQQEKPDWVSLQYVPFSFSPKGFPLLFANHLNKITKGCKIHIMFHELWVGMDKGCSPKEAFYGILQKTLIRAFLATVRYDLVATQSELYKRALTGLGLAPFSIPLFSNIPRVTNGAESRHRTALRSLNGQIRFGLFGTIHEKNELAAFAKELNSICHKLSIKAALVLIGRNGGQKSNVFSICQQHGIEVTAVNETTAEEASLHLSSLDWGLTTTVFSKIDKSGSVAAMQEHGLNVISLAHKCGTDPDLHALLKQRFQHVYEYVPGGLETYLLSENKVPIFEPLPKVADLFLASLGKY